MQHLSETKAAGSGGNIPAAHNRKRTTKAAAQIPIKRAAKAMIAISSMALQQQ
jgi:hypothetical protein